MMRIMAAMAFLLPPVGLAAPAPERDQQLELMSKAYRAACSLKTGRGTGTFEVWARPTQDKPLELRVKAKVTTAFSGGK